MSEQETLLGRPVEYVDKGTFPSIEGVVLKPFTKEVAKRVIEGGHYPPELINDASLEDWSIRLGIQDQELPDIHEEKPEIVIPAISVINGTKESVVILKLPESINVDAMDMDGIKAKVMDQLVGSCLEGCAVLVIGGGTEMTVVNAEEGGPVI